jgi:hypothetical protein
MVHVREYFSKNYREAAKRFEEVAGAVGLTIERHTNGNGKGPNGGELFASVARIGPKGTPNVIFANSATHGVEGFCGSGCQIGWMAMALHHELADDTALVLVHAINPHGFAHERRVTEDNVDLNRNFRDFSRKAPANPAYAEIHAHLVPADWEGAAHKAADAAITAYIARNGERAFQSAVSTGQWEFADGLFFGGNGPTWSHKTWRTIIRQHAAGARRIVHLDFHTGLGGYGDCELIFGPSLRKAGDLERARAWFGNVAYTGDGGESLSANVQGVNCNALPEEVPGAEVTAIALEYGTKPVMDVLNALRADHWLHKHGNTTTAQGQAIKRRMRAAFYGESDDWKERVFAKSVEVLRQSIAGLARP